MAYDLSNPIYRDEEAAREHLEGLRWPQGPYCPRCGVMGDRITKLQGKSLRPGVYKCKDCRKPFTVTVGTVYERSHIPLHKWLLATHLLCASKKGMSSKQFERMLGVTYKTAWFMSHRIREAMAQSYSGPMGGGGKVVEADETYWGNKTKPRENLRGWHHMMKVVALVERGGTARAFHMEDLNKTTVKAVLDTHVASESTLMTDEARVYITPGASFARHERVAHAKGEYVRDDAHTNTVEGYFSIFKRGMIGTYHHCAEKHLHRYLAEFDFRYNARSALGVEDMARAARAVKGITGKRLTYRRTNGRATTAA